MYSLLEDNSPLLEAPQKTGTGEGENASAGPATYSSSSSCQVWPVARFPSSGKWGLAKEVACKQYGIDPIWGEEVKGNYSQWKPLQKTTANGSSLD